MRTLFLVCLLASVAWADVVVVGKREFRGEIVEDDGVHLKIKVGDGYLTFDKKNVKEIRRESELDTLLGAARTLSKTLDAKALQLYDQAIQLVEKSDPAKANELLKERNAYAAKLENETTRQAVKREAVDAKTAEGDLFLLQADLEEARLYVDAFKQGDKNAGRTGAAKLAELGQKHLANGEPRWAVGCFALGRSIDAEDAKRLWTAERISRLRACGQAVREHDPKVARAAIAEIAKDEASDAHVAYLDGRAFEAAGNPGGAREAFKRALEGTKVPSLADLAVDLLRELARRRARGLDVGPGSPGVGEQWRRVETAHFVVYHELGDDFVDSQPRAFEDARSAALLRLGLAEGDPNALKVPMFIFKDREGYVKGGGSEWAGGHVGIVSLEDGPARTVFTYPGRQLETSLMQHELAHVLVDEAFPRLILAPWAAEGVACFAEPDDSRARRRIETGRAIASGSFVPLKDFLGRATMPPDNDTGAIAVFYAESTVVFSALQAKAGSVKDALEVASRIARKGADAGLRELGTDAATLESEIKADLSGGK